MAQPLDATMRPLCNHLLVKQIEHDTPARPEMICDDRATDTPRHARVIAVGVGAVTEPGRTSRDIKVGDRVLLGHNSGDPVRLDGKEYILMRAHDVLALVAS